MPLLRIVCTAPADHSATWSTLTFPGHRLTGCWHRCRRCPLPTSRVHVTVQPSESLLPASSPSPDDETMVWADVVHELHAAGRLSWISVLLVVIASAIAAVGIIEGQLLLIVGAMALSPGLPPIANTYLDLARRAWRAVGGGTATLLITFAAAVAAAWALSAFAGTDRPPNGTCDRAVARADPVHRASGRAVGCGSAACGRGRCPCHHLAGCPQPRRRSCLCDHYPGRRQHRRRDRQSGRLRAGRSRASTCR